MTQQTAPAAVPIQAPPAPPAQPAQTASPASPPGDLIAPGPPWYVTTQPAYVPPYAFPPLPNEYVTLATLLILVTLLPLSVAMARRLWRRGENPATSTNPRLDDRLASMQDAIDSIAFEVERIGEGQRYVTSLLASAKAVPLDSVKQLPDVGQKPDFRSITPH